MGRAPIVKTSRRMPPTPVAAPWCGSMKLGWLCDSILKTAAKPSPMSTTPAFSPGPWMTRGPFVGRRRRWTRLRLVRAVLAPHHAEDAELGVRRRAAERALDDARTPRRQLVLLDERRGDRQVAGEGPGDLVVVEGARGGAIGHWNEEVAGKGGGDPHPRGERASGARGTGEKVALGEAVLKTPARRPPHGGLTRRGARRRRTQRTRPRGISDATAFTGRSLRVGWRPSTSGGSSGRAASRRLWPSSASILSSRPSPSS